MGCEKPGTDVVVDVGARIGGLFCRKQDPKYHLKIEGKEEEYPLKADLPSFEAATDLRCPDLRWAANRCTKPRNPRRCYGRTWFGILTPYAPASPCPSYAMPHACYVRCRVSGLSASSLMCLQPPLCVCNAMSVLTVRCWGLPGMRREEPRSAARAILVLLLPHHPHLVRRHRRGQVVFARHEGEPRAAGLSLAHDHSLTVRLDLRTILADGIVCF